MADSASAAVRSSFKSEVDSDELRRRRETERLGTDPIVPLVLRLSLPAMTGLLVSSLYVFVDRVFVGRYVGEVGLAAMNVAIPFSTLVFSFSILVGRGCSVIYSIALGRKDYAEARRIFSGGVFLHMIVSLFIMVFCQVFLNRLLNVFGAEPQSIDATRRYVSIVLLGTPFAMLTMHNHLIRAEGASTYSMMTQVTGALLNVILDWVFMAHFRWGIGGAAFATVIAQAVSVIMVMWFFMKRSVVRFRVADMIFSARMLWLVLINGFTPFIFNAAATLNWTIQNHMIKRHAEKSGFSVTTAMAAFGIVMSLRMLIMTPILGLSMGMQPLVGYNYGSGQYARMRNIFKFSVLTAFLLMLIPYGVLEIFSYPVVRFFGAENDTLVLGVYTLRRFMLLMPLGGIAAMFSHFFQGTGKPVEALVVTGVRQVVLAFPFLIILPYFLGYDGIVFATPIAEVGGAIFGVFVILREFRRLRVKENEMDLLKSPMIESEHRLTCSADDESGSTAGDCMEEVADVV